MTVNVESWKTLLASDCQLVSPLSRLAKAADIESLENAFEAGLASSGSPDYLQAIATLADGTVANGSIPPRVEKLIFQWAATCTPDNLAKALIETTWNRQPEANSILVRAGADPYQRMAVDKTGNRDTKACAIEKVLNFNVDESVDLLRPLIGTGPITDPAQLPRRLPFSNIFLPQPFVDDLCNVLERAIVAKNMAVAASIVDRIDRGSPARSLLFDLGDVALRLLGMDASGDTLPGHETIDMSHTNLAMAYSFLVAGAEFRDPKIWEKIAERKINGQGDQSFLRTAVQTGYLALPTGTLNAALEMFIDRGLLDINGIDASGHSMLMSAALHNQPEIVDFLLQHGADVLPTATIDSRKTPVDALYYAKKYRTSDMAGKILAAAAKQAIMRTIDRATAARDGVTERTSP